MPLYQVNAGDRILAADINQFYQILKGVAASGENITLIYNAASALIFQPSSDPAADTVAVAIKNNAGSQQSGLTYDGNATFKTYVKLTAAASKIIPGATSLSLRNNGDSADNLIITDAGIVTVRQQLVIPVSSYIAWGAANIMNNDGTFTTIRATGATNDLVVTTTSATQVGKLIASGTLTAGGLLTNAVQVGTSGPLIYSGSGAPSISAAVKGSLYMRTDGSGTGDRVYVAKDTAGAWAALTAAS